MNKCTGCGAFLQQENIDKEGYTKELNKNFCERCFRINHYNEYQKINKNNIEFIEILKKINSTDLVVLVVDTLTVTDEVKIIDKYLNNPKIIVFNKRDLLPFKLKEEKILNFAKKLEIFDEVIITSAVKNIGLDLLMERINHKKTSDKVYFVGFTNAGKSSLINKIIYNYTNDNSNITISPLPSTTLNNIEIKTKDFILIDTPGLIKKGDLLEFIPNKLINKLIPKKEIKPITYNVKSDQWFLIDDFFALNISNSSVTFFISNLLNIKRLYNKPVLNLKEFKIEIKEAEDLVIVGFGFLKFKNKTNIKLYLPDNVLFYTRKSLI